MEAIIARIEHSDNVKQIKNLQGQVRSNLARDKELTEMNERLRKEIDDKNNELAIRPVVTESATAATVTEVIPATTAAAEITSANPATATSIGATTEPTVPPPTAPAETVVGMSEAEHAACEEELQGLMEQLQSLNEKLKSLRDALPEAEEACANDAAAKTETKNAIKVWMKAFEKENGTCPVGRS